MIADSGESVARGGKIRVGRAALIVSAPRIRSRTGRMS
jgi:hypothetical protein